MTPQQELAMAFKIASEAHLKQKDKAGLPYIMHTTKVMHYVKSDDLQVKAIAVMHDLLEDCPKWTIQRLREVGFSHRVIRGVYNLTKKPGQTVEEYTKLILTNYDSILVKLADLRHNSDIRRLKGLREKDFERLVKYQTMYHILNTEKNRLEAINNR